MDYRAGIEAADRMKGQAEVLRVRNVREVQILIAAFFSTTYDSSTPAVAPAQVGHMLFLENPSSFLEAVLHVCQVQRLSSFKAVEVCTRDDSVSALEESRKLVAEDGGIKAQRIVAARKLAEEWGVG